MNKKLPLLIFIICALFLMFTNPNEEKHKDAVKKVVLQSFKKEMAQNLLDSENGNSLKGVFQGIGALIGEKYIENLVDGLVSRENFGIFSLTQVDWKGEKKNIGIGILGNVFVTEKIKDFFEKEKNIQNQESENEESTEKTEDENKIIQEKTINEDSKDLINEISDHWYALTPKKNELVIYIPCDAQNTEIILKKNEDKTFLENIAGQDSLEYSVISCKKTDKGYSIIAINPYTKKEIVFEVENIDNVTNTATWSWNDEDWAGNNNIKMVSTKGKSNFKTVEEPPCLE